MRAIRVERLSWAGEPGPGLLATLCSAAIAAAGATAGWLRRTRCGLGGHSMMLEFEPGRLSLRCHDCGEQTAGWVIGR